ncbi:4a-hydroxytetrahydrobiopterin dehydratase KNAG_0C05560 [Huiozyma naganishii CBS 8797]|uniref:4a-hydroxytetrahydrobiopterin dehydratase n=1 Tax=Huiozyma naganishii (strain ATCC MYA-139 / BCRC 22969 / CBS 8797 / KCTC 17520 / NBRC 10181 / NCYC 3082 / Yp74L-3) TaxID=1071383 RepID=J7S545_HUIN7|nr:hypothetical protein KNAG_0C05560 [Kazachstania naganishii CBS 8797]CCK69654.1 hypothetical protein KNAG_0C05560 [Kazachstania naganishii CBS 8797]
MFNKIVRVAARGIPLDELPVQLSKAGLASLWLVQRATNGTDTGKLVRECTFPDFESTWGFLTQVSMRSHLWGHHPTITTTYNKVKLELATHDLEQQPNSVSDVDLKMAKRIEKYIHMYSGSSP